ncbi:oligoendopeptidase, M3 family [Peptoclostridium litorale DSM 5388]|uniref:Oligoendopeptidase, M3 family n=1 Tax=Peptoclostridium litorale DSM 5388 TaxID=1121324 RepID=A0A069RPR6_PEPLI|nr:M3 family oligoendopeptidase [Peptoclostridium litorale]KDR96152.1 oligoendopeptidase, M3 family [Peptoclostridium litorale DSM 5388]SIO03478.1 oligoendopeptidase, M3 family [Peptoclostridium litorale DSM 5388]
MKFSEYKYERPSFEKVQLEFQRLVQSIGDSKSADDALAAVRDINDLRAEFETQQQIAYIRNTMDTEDELYKAEQEFYDDITPMYEGLINSYYFALAGSKFANELKAHLGEQLLNLANLKTRIFSDCVIEDMKMENKLCTQYTKLLSSAKIEFEGQINTLSQMRYHQMSLDRDVRKKANSARYSFFEKNKEEFDSIYTQLVEVRSGIAERLGYQSFTGLAYDRMGRTDYGPLDVAKLRESVKKHIVPLCTRLRQLQKKRLNLKELKYYDESVQFKDGNAKLIAGEKEMLRLGISMYEGISKEAGSFFRNMVQNGLMDLLSKQGKSPGGYCTYIPKYNTPFIFSNFNGTIDDIDVLTHEAGHAFQMHMSKDFNIAEYSFPTLDACEIHSMSMEFLTWPWMDMFFGEDADKYRLGHISEAVLFLPYGALVDEFQHVVYENPGMSESERNDVWRRLEREYLPHRDYDGNEFLESGTYWYQQGHIFKNPFYYIDYVLAGICAIQFLKRFRGDRESAWIDYEKLCRIGGSMSFMDIVKSAGLDSPFEEEAVKMAAQTAQEIIYSYCEI